MTSKHKRIAIVNPDKCKPKRCNLECKNNCPVVRMGKLCIDVTSSSKISYISNELCTGCGICVKKCPFNAIKLINLPSGLPDQIIHSYGENSFRLHRLPMPRTNSVLGIVGKNGIGKSTAIKILGNKLEPNFNQEISPTIKELIKYYRGNALQNYFSLIQDKKLIPAMKPQHIIHFPKYFKGTTTDFLAKMKVDIKLESTLHYLKLFQLTHLLTRNIDELSGGELQRFAILVTILKPKANTYIFDEPSSFLDIKQRMIVSHAIQNLKSENNYIIVVEHDLAVLDYISDHICCFYGEPSAYGVSTEPSTVLEGINMYLDGYFPKENMRFRDHSLTFNISTTGEEDEEIIKKTGWTYPDQTIKLEGRGEKDSTFELHIEKGHMKTSEIIVLLGENGTGKTTFCRTLRDKMKDDYMISYKPQHILPKYKGTVLQFLIKVLGSTYHKVTYQTQVVKPLGIDKLGDLKVEHLSGGQLQKVAIATCLGKKADIYLLDEPSANLDSEERINVAKIIKRYCLNLKKVFFVVEHDFIMATYLADQVVVFSGTPGVKCTAHSAVGMQEGMNSFLKQLNITIRRDPTNHRPRINKLNSVKDQEQKKSGNYFGC